MEDNENLEVEQEVTDEDLDAFDESWDDDPDSKTEESGEDIGEDETEETEEDGAEPEPETGNEGEEGNGGEAEEPGEEAEERNQLFSLKYLGNEEQYDLEHFTELAQKGRNYDHVVEERDKLKSETAKQTAFLKKLADKAGVSVDDQIALTEAMWLMDEEAEKGNTITEAEAILRVQKQKQEEPKNEEADNKDKTDTNAMIDRFLSVYPDVKASDIPQSVWDDARKTGDLLVPYQAFEIKRLKEENEKTKQSVQNERNKERSTGPRRTAGATTPKDSFDEGWDS